VTKGEDGRVDVQWKCLETNFISKCCGSTCMVLGQHSKVINTRRSRVHMHCVPRL
jgi:hypothetical protein